MEHLTWPDAFAIVGGIGIIVYYLKFLLSPIERTRCSCFDERSMKKLFDEIKKMNKEHGTSQEKK